MRPALKPGLLPVWRNRDTVQIGIDHRRAIALTGMGQATGLLALLDGSRDLAQLVTVAGELGIPAATVHRVISLLAAGGALADYPASSYRSLPQGLRHRLAPELATAALAHGDGDGGARTLARRQGACIRVAGLSPIGLSAASLLACAGIGRVVAAGRVVAPPVAQDGAAITSRRQRPPPGSARAGHPELTADLVTLAGTDQCERAGAGRTPDLVILADSYQRELPGALLRAGVPHLAMSAGEAIGVVGPLVLPGRTACLRCLDLTRAERDPAWPLILAQLTSGGADPPACDTVLATAVAAQAAAQALSFVDRGAAASAAVNGTLELVLPDWQWRRRSWPPHDHCLCGRHCAGDSQ